MVTLKFLPSLLFLLLMAARTEGGLGPETTLLVVNADSPLSLTVANQWMKLRPIPANHVVWLHGIPSLGKISMEQNQTKQIRSSITVLVTKYAAVLEKFGGEPAQARA